MRARSNGRCQLAVVAGLVLVLGGCSGTGSVGHTAGATVGAGVSAGGGPSGGASSGPSSAPGTSVGTGTGTQPSDGGSTNAPSSGPSTGDTAASRYPSPPGMSPPTATAASVVGCQPLTGGGWQATFLVTLIGGLQWAVLATHGPATRTGDDQWTIVIQQGPGGAVTIPLTRVEVGGGSPFRTTYVPLAPGIAVTASCPS